MPITRSEVGNMSDTGLRISSDRLRERLRSDWQRGAPGKLTDLYDLSLIYAEAVVRGVPLPAPMLPGQLGLELELVPEAHD